MTGKAHLKIGILTCAIASTASITIPFISTIPKGTNIAALVIAGAAALIVDADSQHSKINRINPATRVLSEGVELIEDGIKILVRMILTFGTAFLILYYSDCVMLQISKVPKLNEHPKIVMYGIAAFMIFLGICNKKILYRVPVFGSIYKIIANGVDAAASVIKRFFMFMVYAGAGSAILEYNFKNGGETSLYIIGFMFIAIAVFPHRSFMHSVLEGLPVLTFAGCYTLNKLGYGYLTGAFFIGYASHILLADMLTNEGVPLSVIPKILHKTGIHNMLEQFSLYRIIHSILSFRLRIPIMSTGTPKGNMFEFIYTTALFVVAIVCFFIFDVSIQII